MTIVLAIVLPLAVLFMAVLAQVAGIGRIPRNGMLGLRVPSTMASDEAWRAGHRAATLPAWIGFVVMTVIAVLSLIFTGQGAAQVAWTVVGLALFVLVSIWTLIAAHRGARSVRTGA